MNAKSSMDDELISLLEDTKKLRERAIQLHVQAGKQKRSILKKHLFNIFTSIDDIRYMIQQAQKVGKA